MASADPGIQFERRFPARAEELKQIRVDVRRCAEAAGASAAAAEDVVLAVDEACQNIIRHAYCDETRGDIEIRMQRDGDSLVIWLQDFAPEVDPECLERGRDLEDVRPGGLGTRFMKELMDDVGFVTRSGEAAGDAGGAAGQGNLLRMVKRLASAGE